MAESDDAGTKTRFQGVWAFFRRPSSLSWSVLAGEAAERGRTPVLVIDEAHLLDHDQLESIRMMTNHDMDSSTPFATILVGQPTLRHSVKLGVLAALEQRIFAEIDPRHDMTGAECHLFRFGEEIIRIAIQHHLADHFNGDNFFRN